MSSKARVRRKFQVTIPQEIREIIPLEEGQYVNIEATANGILITPAREIDPDQGWFWSPQWAVREREADTDYRAGRTTVAESADKAIAALKKKPTARKKK